MTISRNVRFVSASFNSLRRALLLSATMLGAAPAFGQALPAPADAAADNIVVTGYRFLDKDTSGITNLPLTIDQVPQSISLINNDFARAADLKNLGEVAQHVTGAIWASYSPSYGNQIWLRGFAANFAIDGLPVGDQITEPDPATLERFEVVKGPASVVYGAQSPGGIVDLVQKSATPGTPSYIEALGGSWRRWRLEGQLAGALNASGSIRAVVTAAHEEGGSFVDFVKLRKTVLYGGLDFDLAPELTGYVRVSYQDTQDTPFNGIPTFANGTQVPLPRSYFLGNTALLNTTHATSAHAALTWKPSSAWTLDAKAIYQYTTHAGGNVYPYSTIAPNGSFPVGGEVFEGWHVSDFSIAGSARRTLDDIGLKDSSISLNVRYQHYRYFIDEGNYSSGTANLFDGEQAVSDVFQSLTVIPNGYEQDERLNYLTASAQAVIKPARLLTLVGGVAWSRPTTNQQVYGGAFQNFDPGSQVDFRAAAIVEPVGGVNLYASFSQSYEPNLRIDTRFNVLPPVKGNQYEAGMKIRPDKRLLLTAAVFEIDEKNVAEYAALVDGEALYQAENVRHRGLELEAAGFLTRRWQVKAGLALLDPKVTSDPASPINDGETRPWLSRTTGNLFTTYDLGQGFDVSGGLRYVSSVKTYDTSSAVQTPAISAYTLVDFAAGYIFDKWQLQFNLKNAFDKHYAVITPVFASLSAGLYPGEPRSFTISLRRKF